MLRQGTLWQLASRALGTTTNPLTRLPLIIGGKCFCSEVTGANDSNRPLVNQLLYRSKQRGWLELDLLMGMWAQQQVPIMPEHMLKDYAIVLDQENPDLYKWLTDQVVPPESMQRNTAFQALQQHVREQMLQNSQPSAKADPGKEWVRGWDDSWRSSQPSSLNSNASKSS